MKRLDFFWGFYQKGYTLVLLKQNGVTWFLALGRGAARALNTSKTHCSASAPRPRCLGSINDNFFYFKGVTWSNCSAEENEGLFEYPFLQRKQEQGTRYPQLEVYILPFLCTCLP